MDNLRAYYDSLDTAEREDIAGRAGTTVDYLYQICRGDRKPGHSLARSLADVTGIDKSIWRPDIWDVA